MSRFNALILSIALFSAVPLSGVAADGGKHAKEEKIEVKDLPEAVKAGFEKAAPGAEIVKVVKIPGDKPSYRFYYKLNGKDAHFKVDSEGNRLAHPKK